MREERRTQRHPGLSELQPAARRAFLFAALTALFLSAPTGQAGAADPADHTRDAGQPTAGSRVARDEESDEEPAADDSPRASLEKFFALCAGDNYAEAAAYLDTSRVPMADGATLARRLKAVIDRRLWLEPEEVSGTPEGSAEMGLPSNVEQLGTIPTKTDENPPLRMVRKTKSKRWVFSPASVARIDAWYEALEGRWLLEGLPSFLLRPGPKNMLWWQWIALPVLLLVASVAGAVVSRIVRAATATVTKRTRTSWDDEALHRLTGPLTLATTVGFALALLPFLDLYRPANDFFLRLLKGVLLGDVFWAFSRLIDVAAEVARKSTFVAKHPSSRALIPLASRVGKVVVLALGVTTLLSELGYPVASLLAGLGLGGLAFALAAQKTVENLFGAFSIGADQPFREGDFIRVDDFVGTVEAIGLRSTKIRTLDRTLVTLPNGSLAEKRLESFTARDRIRLACTLGLVYSTTAEQMQRVLSDLETHLRSHPKIWPDAVVVRFSGFGASSLDIEIMCWFQTSDWSEFQLIRQNVFLAFMGIVERNGSEFAFPTRTVHMLKEPSAPREA